MFKWVNDRLGWLWVDIPTAILYGLMTGTAIGILSQLFIWRTH